MYQKIILILTMLQVNLLIIIWSKLKMINTRLIDLEME